MSNLLKPIPLGYEIGTGEPVEVPRKHMAVTGQSQEAGKTTALEAMIDRSGLRAITFITKRGEGSFSEGRRLEPYFRERADWVFVSSLIDATLGEKNKFLRGWLMKVCRGTRTLAEVHANVKSAQKAGKGFNEIIYTQIDGYLDLVVPQLQDLPMATGIKLGDGLNVMDLSPYSAELQGLVIRSVLEHIYEHEDGVVTVIPEAWEFIPEGRGSPVKLAAETLIRKGASLKNYIWIDSQDMAGVWKLALRAAAVWLIGVQRESNEIKRTLSNIPAGVAKPKAADIASLELGQFYACWGNKAVRTYVRPKWMCADEAQAIAMGKLSVGPKPSCLQDPPLVNHQLDSKTLRGKAPQIEDDMSKEDIDVLRGDIQSLARSVQALVGHAAKAPSSSSTPSRSALVDEEAIYQRFKSRLMDEAPALVRVLVDRPELEVKVTRVAIEADGSSLKGRIGRLIVGGFLAVARSHTDIRKELERTGAAVHGGNLSTTLKDFVRMGFLTDEKEGYLAVKGMKSKITEV